MLLCDAVQSVGGKLYILGGGWTHLHIQSPPNVGLAIKIEVPWNRANERHTLVVALKTEDGDAVEMGGTEVAAQGEIEVGRPAGLKPGTPLDSPLALNFAGLVFEPGGYVWELLINGEPVGRTPFRVVAGSQ
jgi:hypothetical protein